MKYLIHLIWLIPIVMVVVIYKNSTKRVSRPNAGGIKWGSILMKTAGVVLLLGMGSCAFSCAYTGYKLATGMKNTVQQPPQKVTTSAEGLVLMYEGWTPCRTFVGWNYKVRTDGDPIRIKYKGCEWFNQPAKGDYSAPKGFQPGEAEIESSDLNNPHVKVWVYKRIRL